MEDINLEDMVPQHIVEEWENKDSVTILDDKIQITVR